MWHLRIDRRFVVLALAIIAIATAGIIYLTFRPKPLDSLAVLPFMNVGADPGTEYLSDGITESIINNLSQLPNVSVRSFSSVSRYRNKDIDPQEAGRGSALRLQRHGRRRSQFQLQRRQHQQHQYHYG